MSSRWSTASPSCHLLSTPTNAAWAARHNSIRNEIRSFNRHMRTRYASGFPPEPVPVLDPRCLVAVVGGRSTTADSDRILSSETRRALRSRSREDAVVFCSLLRGVDRSGPAARGHTSGTRVAAAADSARWVRFSTHPQFVRDGKAPVSRSPQSSSQPSSSISSPVLPDTGRQWGALAPTARCSPLKTVPRHDAAAPPATPERSTLARIPKGLRC